MLQLHLLRTTLTSLALLLILVGCTPATTSMQASHIPAQATPTLSVQATAIPPTATAQPIVQPIQLVGWHVLYQRAGWNGGATIDLRAVGDIMLGRLVGTIAQTKGLDYPFAATHTLLAGDLALGNLESPLTTRTTPLRPGPYRLPASPDFATPLYNAGFQVLSLANNHALDVGPDGLSDSVAALQANPMLAVGAGPNAHDASAPQFSQVNGLRVAWFGFNAIHDPEDKANEGATWGRAWLNSSALDQVRQARRQTDLVVVMVHWGQEYASQISDYQRKWASDLVAAGADLIIGAHPHVLQTTESLNSAGRSGFVAYSLGNFIFDQSARNDTSNSAILRVLLDTNGVALVAAAPIEVVAGQARPLALTSAAARNVLSTLNGTSQAPQYSDLATPNQSKLFAWSWDGRNAHPIHVPANTPLAERPKRIAVDLRGNGEPLWASLDASGLVKVRDGTEADAPVVWQNESPDWQVTRIDAGDPNNDGRIELIVLLWKADGSHPFLVGWRNGIYHVIWGGSAPKIPIQDVAVGDLNGDGWQELAVLEGGQHPGDPAQSVSIWRWNGWMFDLQWRSNIDQARGLALQDLNGDRKLDIVVSTQ